MGPLGKQTRDELIAALEQAQKELKEGRNDVALMDIAQAQINAITRLADEVDRLNAAGGKP